MSERPPSDSGAGELLIVKDQGAEDAQSPEFRYLLSWVINQARKAFASVAVRVRRADGPVAVTVTVAGRR